MKKTMTYLLLLAGTLLLAGCQKEGGLFGGNGEIRFSASARPDTKTVYGGYYKENDDHNWEKVDPADATWQSIDWTAGDEIRIYSDKAVRRVGFESGAAADALYHWADYSLTNVTAGTANTEAGWSSATLVNMSNDGTGDPYDQEKVGDAYHVGNGLMWPDSDPAKFYAVYPRLRPISWIPEDEGTAADPPAEEDDPYQYALLGVSGKFPLNIPDQQDFSVRGNLSEYGYMTAMGSGKASDKNVTLEFSPAFTAFEISIRSEGDPIELSQFKLVSEDDSALYGHFTVKYDASGNRTFICDPANAEGTTGKEIVVNLSGQVAPSKTDAETKDLTFTVLAMPQDFEKLRVEFTKKTGETSKLALREADVVTTSGTTPGDYVKFNKCVKHRIYGLFLPNGELLISVGTAPWLAGGEFEFKTIENVTTSFAQVKRFDVDGDYSTWDIPGTYIQIAQGIIDEEPVDPEDPTQGTKVTHRPLYSPMFILESVSVGIPLELRSDNPHFKFVTTNPEDQQASLGTYTAPKESLLIRASAEPTVDGEGKIIDDLVVTHYFVVAEDASIGESANIRLIRTDKNVPVAYCHSLLPGSLDHTKVPFWVSSVSDYTKNQQIIVP